MLIITFEQWWKENYEWKLSKVPVLEKAFKEIAEKAWEYCYLQDRLIRK